MKRLSRMVLCLLILMLMTSVSFAAGMESVEIWDGSSSSRMEGSGTAKDPYLIENGAQLYYVASSITSRQDWEGEYFELANDIYLNDTTDWESWSAYNAPENNWIIEDSIWGFSGVLDGKNHTIYGLYLVPDTGDNVGLFHRVGAATLKNLRLEESYINTSARYAGGLFGQSSGAVRIMNCHNGATVVGSGTYLGGLGGSSSQGTFQNCSNHGTISGSSSRVGGIVGDNNNEIRECSNTGNISSTAQFADVGGVVGNGGTVINCMNAGTIKAMSKGTAGGVAGEGDYMLNCGNVGAVTGNYRAGGVAGQLFSGTGELLWNAGTVSGSASNLGAVVGYGAQSSFLNCYYLSSSASYAFGSVFQGTYDKVYSFQSTLSGDTLVDTLNTLITEEYAGQGLISWSFQAEKGDWPYLELRTLKSISVTTPPTAQEFFAGLPFDATGMVVTAQYDDGSSEPVVGYTVTPDPLTEETTSVTIAYRNKVTTLEVSVKPIAFSAGSGTEKAPYEIEDLQELLLFRMLVNGGVDGFKSAHYKLVADIAVDDQNWTPIGIPGAAFVGYFDGGDHTISDLRAEGEGFMGLFGAVDGGTVRNLKVEDATFICPASYSSGAAGIIAVASDSAQIAYVTSADSVLISGSMAGGIVGLAQSSTTVSGCESYAGVVGAYAGGIAGGTSGANLYDCVNYGEASGTKVIGGITSNLTVSGLVMDSVNRGTVTGLVSDSIVGGLVGMVTKGTVMDSANYSDINTTGNTLGGCIGVTLGGSMLSGCDNYGNVTCSGKVAGGITGSAMADSTDGVVYIKECRNLGDVTATSACDNLGGIAGMAYDDASSRGMMIYYCCNSGNVSNSASSTGDCTGGLLGYANYVDMKSCYNTGRVSGGYGETGGLGGYVSYTRMSNCYTAGVVSGRSYYGSCFGRTYYDTVTDCYYLNSVTAMGAQGTNYTMSVTGKTLADMQSDAFCATLELGSDLSEALWGRAESCNDGLPVFADELPQIGLVNGLGVTVNMKRGQAGTLIAAVYDSNGWMLASAMEEITEDPGILKLRFGKLVTLPEDCVTRVYLLDEDLAPIGSPLEK